VSICTIAGSTLGYICYDVSHYMCDWIFHQCCLPLDCLSGSILRNPKLATLDAWKAITSTTTTKMWNWVRPHVVVFHLFFCM
jgi:hypothetical protein